MEPVCIHDWNHVWLSPCKSFNADTAGQRPQLFCRKNYWSPPLLHVCHLESITPPYNFVHRRNLLLLPSLSNIHEAIVSLQAKIIKLSDDEVLAAYVCDRKWHSLDKIFIVTVTCPCINGDIMEYYKCVVDHFHSDERRQCVYLHFFTLMTFFTLDGVGVWIRWQYLGVLYLPKLI